MRVLLAALVVLGLAADVRAATPYMWGVGPRVGTHVLPAGYPAFWPPIVGEDGHIEPVREDFLFGLQGTYYAGEKHRITGLFGADLGARFWDIHGLAMYEFVPYTGAVDFIVGGGLGVGQHTYSGLGPLQLVEIEDGTTTATRDPSPASLRIPNFPFRGHLAAQVRTRFAAFQGSVFAQYNLPINHVYTNPEGFKEKVGTGFYIRVGIELSVLFGDFTPPKPDSIRRKRKKKKGGHVEPEDGDAVKGAQTAG